MKTTAIFFPFGLFGSPGAAGGAELLSDAFAEMLADNRREKVPTRANAYQNHVRSRDLTLETLADYEQWRPRARQVVRQIFQKSEFLLWATGNHLGVLPVYEELSRLGTDTLVIQFDAHLDIYNLSDCTAELSHGNFLLHSAEPLPALVNVGHRELLLRPEYIGQYYRTTWDAAHVARDPNKVVRELRKVSRSASQVILDIDCDVLDPSCFPAVAHPLPFGLSPALLLRLLDAAWSPRVIGVALSEFDPGRDTNDRCLSVLVWLLEYLLLRRYE